MKLKSQERGQTRYYLFHRSNRHDTNDCHQLIWEIERLMKKGYLKRFVRKEEAFTKREENKKREAQPMPVNDGSSGTIHMIVGRPLTCERRRRKRKGIQKIRDSKLMQHEPSMQCFLAVKLPMLYNAILRRSVLYDFEITTSIKYLMMKFPIEWELQ
ncbi:hypothetical protein P3X46_016907 [Hevea brasiliensis]|uniref:Uncharacterized protein n=1 Tax=Hevea brasiliensis TaxID=3981 RepID=A0ABQ9M0K7_HEVBR|nr:hypothetical protein P3X46_016907 [Hevea brasiliensis]